MSFNATSWKPPAEVELEFAASASRSNTETPGALAASKAANSSQNSGVCE